MIKEIQTGEIVRIKGREWLLIETAVGNSDKFRPTLILLKNTLNGINRKSYFKGENSKINTSIKKKDVKNLNLIKLNNFNKKIEKNTTESFLNKNFKSILPTTNAKKLNRNIYIV